MMRNSMGDISDTLDSRIVDVIGFTPEWIGQPLSWAGHLHFANFLIKECRPNIFVELGTHSGNSYFSFCQSVKEQGIPTKCYAIDTWIGDPHAGEYGNEVYEEVLANNKQYSNFSTLLRMTFDSARAEFEDKSIDLLHIDGLHTYDAVKHDFESWLPKLTENAIVLFHDTQVHSADFGVWRLWQELKNSYKHNLEFTHSNGLGILCINKNLDEKGFEWLFQSPEKENTVFKYFTEVGNNLSNYEKDKFVIQKLLELLNIELTLKDEQNEVTKFNKLKITIQNLQRELRTKSALMYEAEYTRNKLQIDLLNVINSRSWKITLPVRELNRWLKSPKQQLNRYLELFINNPKVFLSEKNKNKIWKYINGSESSQYEKLIKSDGLRLIAKIGGSSEFKKVEHLALDQRVDILSKIFKDLNCRQYVSSSPIVSIIIPVYGKIDYTLCALLSIFHNTPKNSFEIIVINDCSLDATKDILENTQGINLVNSFENKGFISSCNIGASVAKGKYLYFLNNDVEVFPEWLDVLVETFKYFPGTGLVGSKLIYPDGRLQEAGGIIWRDGSAWNFGRNANSLDPVFNYAREVDYCSGASIMIPKNIFDSLGGFDERYVPAYYEDVDIAFKLRERGYRVIYQPQSVVIHYEGVSSGTDIKSGVKAYQEINKDKFYQRWEKKLENHQLPGEGLDDAKDRMHKKRILVIDNNTLTPDQDAGSLLIFNLCVLLRDLGFQVTFIASAAMINVEKHTQRLQKVGIEVVYAPYVKNVEEHLKILGLRYQVVMMVRPDCLINVVELIKQYCPEAKLIFHTIDLHFIRMMRESLAKSSDSIMSDALKMKALEFKAVNEVDVTIAVTNDDAKALQKEMPDKNIFTLGLILETYKNIKPYSHREGLVFIGGFSHAPNQDAVLYFVNEVMPMLLKYHPDLILTIIGSNIPVAITKLESKNINILGYVANLNEILSNKLVNIAPLRFGAGIKGKIANAMNVGLPSVVTTLASEGMDLIDMENAMIADQPHEIAQAIDKLIRDPKLWSKLSENSIAHAQALWGSKYVSSRLVALFSSIGIQVKVGPHDLKLYDDTLA